MVMFKVDHASQVTLLLFWRAAFYHCPRLLTHLRVADCLLIWFDVGLFSEVGMSAALSLNLRERVIAAGKP